MTPMSDLQNHFRAGLLFLANIASEHYDRLTFLRYYTRDIVFAIEFLV